MRKTALLVLSALILLSVAIVPLSVSAVASPTLVIVEWSVEQSDNHVTVNAIPPTDNSMTNPNYSLSGLIRTDTANYYINPSNKYGFSSSAVEKAITDSANTWDTETTFTVFLYVGATTRSAGKYDGYNVVSWGSYRKGVIAVTYIWYRGSQVLETDTRMNTLYKWSISGETGKMDVQNIMTHEFGHWFVLDDLYNDADYWLTMYGYADYGEIHKCTLGKGDILGLKAIYGA